MGEMKLWAHQTRAVERARHLRDFALFMSVGVGKSATMIAILESKFGHYSKLEGTLILSPLITLHKWKDEFAKFSKVPPGRILVLDGPTISRIARFKEFTQKFGPDFIVITNYESLVSEPFRRVLTEWEPPYLICDESHKLKDRTTVRAKSTRKIAKTARHRFLMSGTPVLNSPIDIFSQFEIMDLGETLGDNFHVFRHKYFWDLNGARRGTRGHFPKWVVRNDAVKELNQLIGMKSVQVKKEDCLDLPPLVKKTLQVELGAEQQAAYTEMKKELITFIRDKACTATIALVKALRLQQIVSGHMPVVDVQGVESVEIFEDNPRLTALKDLLEEITPSHKVIVWAVFKQDYKAIAEVCKSLQLKYKEVHGSVSTKEKFEAVSAFNGDTEIRVMVGHPGSLGIGIDLIAASYSVFYSRNFSLADDIQAEARNYRAGSEIHTSITRIDIIAKNTIDKTVMNALAGKIKIGEDLLRDLSLEEKNEEQSDEEVNGTNELV